MCKKEQETELREAVKITCTEYRAVAEQHEQLLGYAQRAPHGSSAMLGALHCATELGTHVAIALRRYLDAVEILAVFYEDLSSQGEDAKPDAAAYAIAATAPTSHVNIVPSLRRANR